jgi:hypothetical protein
MRARNYANERLAFSPGKRIVGKGFALLGLLGFLVGFVSRTGMGLGGVIVGGLLGWLDSELLGATVV